MKYFMMVAASVGLIALASQQGRTEDEQKNDKKSETVKEVRNEVDKQVGVTSIAETIAKDNNLETLEKAIKEAGLYETLQKPGKFTLFAPTDKAFDKIGKEKLEECMKDKEKLTKVLKLHLIQDKVVYGADVMKLDGEKVNGFPVSMKNRRVHIGVATVEGVDIRCSNGVIHIIDTVLSQDDAKPRNNDNDK